MVCLSWVSIQKAGYDHVAVRNPYALPPRGKHSPYTLLSTPHGYFSSPAFLPSLLHFYNSVASPRTAPPEGGVVVIVKLAHFGLAREINATPPTRIRLRSSSRSTRQVTTSYLLYLRFPSLPLILKSISSSAATSVPYNHSHHVPSLDHSLLKANLNIDLSVHRQHGQDQMLSPISPSASPGFIDYTGAGSCQPSPSLHPPQHTSLILIHASMTILSWMLRFLPDTLDHFSISNAIQTSSLDDVNGSLESEDDSLPPEASESDSSSEDGRPSATETLTPPEKEEGEYSSSEVDVVEDPTPINENGKRRRNTVKLRRRRFKNRAAATPAAPQLRHLRSTDQSLPTTFESVKAPHTKNSFVGPTHDSPLSDGLPDLNIQLPQGNGTIHPLIPHLQAKHGFSLRSIEPGERYVPSLTPSTLLLIAATLL
ncbi:hypothetical protein M407DRAFT_28151 [Tulasnella calospora MUT 4182]|uniref:Uncharacterized protein n=1 Tax=Tulasnella calospora MUT 4182 TaxID=1051891 RepID=A0A0C3QBC0_9AGAM|nr:hypothetical protein M407DRAFT_28151 [Tulasnella calospora MUT 4182]